MALFDAMSIAGSGLTVHRKWLDAVSDNLANLNTVRPSDQDAFQQRYIVAQAVDYGSGRGGAAVQGVLFGSGEGRLVYEPDHPMADKDGNVKYPSIDLAGQMTSLMMAQRGYQANLAVVRSAQESYQAALQFGRGGS